MVEKDVLELTKEGNLICKILEDGEIVQRFELGKNAACPCPQGMRACRYAKEIKGITWEGR